MNTDYLNITKEKMEKAISNLVDRFTTVRAGRANPNMLDDVYVPYYGNPTQLKQVATKELREIGKTTKIVVVGKGCDTFTI